MRHSERSAANPKNLSEKGVAVTGPDPRVGPFEISFGCVRRRADFAQDGSSNPEESSVDLKLFATTFVAEHGHPELRKLLGKLRVEPDAQHDPRHCDDCSAEKIRALFDEERPRAG